jgi:hypothetical protein
VAEGAYGNISPKNEGGIFFVLRPYFYASAALPKEVRKRG